MNDGWREALTELLKELAVLAREMGALARLEREQEERRRADALANAK